MYDCTKAYKSWEFISIALSNAFELILQSETPKDNINTNKDPQLNNLGIFLHQAYLFLETSTSISFQIIICFQLFV
jgi:hypothetical protein